MRENRIEYLFNQYSDDVHTFLVHFTRSRDVDDIVQETFLKAIKGLKNWRGNNPKSWLLSIARNTALDHIKKYKRIIPVDAGMLEEIAASDKSPDEWVEMREYQKQLLQNLQDMKTNYREVIICRALMDLTPQETATVLGWSRSRVDVTLHRAVKNLRTRMFVDSEDEVNDLE